MTNSMKNVGYPENPTVETVIKSLKNCLNRQDSYESCKDCAYYGNKICNRDRMMDHALLFLEMYKNSLDEKQLKDSADYFRKYREEKSEIQIRDETIRTLRDEVKALKTNAYQVGYNEGASKERDYYEESRRWDNYVGM